MSKFDDIFDARIAAAYRLVGEDARAFPVDTYVGIPTAGGTLVRGMFIEDQVSVGTHGEPFDAKETTFECPVPAAQTAGLVGEDYEEIDRVANGAVIARPDKNTAYTVRRAFVEDGSVARFFLTVGAAV